jgi:hypothetical protein
MALFAVGRSAGWIAHVLEQIADGRLVRVFSRGSNPEETDPRPPVVPGLSACRRPRARGERSGPPTARLPRSG